MIDDEFFDSGNTAVVDMAVGLGARYIKVRGINRWERLSKINRYAEILEDLLNK